MDNELAKEAWETYPIYILTLECGHKVATDVELKVQYERDSHMVNCPHNHDFSWRQVTDNTEVTYEMRELLSGIPRIVPRNILRLQPRIQRLPRYRPFPYK